jgi:IclR family transcriptional regulator, KDG regulon repressor
MASSAAAPSFPALRKALSVLSVFTYAEPVLGVSEIGRRLGIGKSTVHRILATLVDEGFVERAPDDRYRLSLKMYEIGHRVVSGQALRTVALGPLERLHAETSEAVNLVVLAGTDVVYLERIETAQMMAISSSTGRRRPAYTSSAGKCLLAFGPPDALEGVIAAGLSRIAPRTITTPTMLRRALAEVRQQGYAISVDEAAKAVASIGAPVFDSSGDCVAAVSLLGPAARMNATGYDRLARRVLAAAAAISRSLRNP